MTIEAEMLAWNRKRFPLMHPGGVSDPRLLAAKLAEECGEVVAATIKIPEGRCTEQDLAGEMGDLLVCAAILAGLHGWTLDELLRAKWQELFDRGHRADLPL